MHAKTGADDVIYYWKEKESNPISDEVFDSVNWGAAKTARQELPMGQRRFFSKFATGHFACGRQMLRRKEWTHDKCPRCGEADENNVKVVQCLDPGAAKTRSKALQSVSDCLEDNKTNPLISRHIMSSLKAWFQGQPLPEPRGSRSLRLALQGQNAIGVWNLLLGRVHKELEVQQDKHYKSQKLRRSGKRWTVELIKKLQMVSWDMWDHRNGILHGNPDKHHRKDELSATNADIEKEWTRGAEGLLAQDQFLFRSKEAVEQRTLEKKWEWLTSVKVARQAAEAAAQAKDSYEPERRRMREFLYKYDQQQDSNKRAQRAPSEQQVIEGT